MKYSYNGNGYGEMLYAFDWRKKMKKWNVKVLVICIVAIFVMGNLWVSPMLTAQAAETIKVRPRYLNDIYKNFGQIKGKYGWTYDGGEFTRLAWCDYKVPNKDIFYSFQGEYEPDWHMTDSCKAIGIYGKVADLTTGMKKNMNINKFVKKLGYDATKMGVVDISNAGGVYRYQIGITKNSGKRAILQIEINSPDDRKVRMNAEMGIIQQY